MVALLKGSLNNHQKTGKICAKRAEEDRKLNSLGSQILQHLEERGQDPMVQLSIFSFNGKLLVCRQLSRPAQQLKMFLKNFPETSAWPRCGETYYSAKLRIVTHSTLTWRVERWRLAHPLPFSCSMYKTIRLL